MALSIDPAHGPDADEPLLTTGRFAERAGLRLKALRRYDEPGLLPPRRVDPFSGYRHCAAARSSRPG